jgi:signal transduction histidine kinase/CheY-like chemotaxis protein
MFKKSIDQFIEFTAPLRKYPDRVQRAKASLLGGLLFVGGTLYIIFIIIEFALNIQYSSLITASRIATVLAIYAIGWINREGYFNLAFILNGLVPIPVVFWSAVILPIDQGSAIIVLLVTIPLASSVFAGLRTTSFMYLMVSVTGTFFLLVVIRANYADVSIHILSLWLVGGLLVLVAAYRNYLENLRQNDLLKSERRYRTLLETSFEAVCVVRDGVLAEVNDGFAKLFDIPLQQSPLGTSIEKWLVLPQHLKTLVETTFETTPNPLLQKANPQEKVLEVVLRQSDPYGTKKTLFVAIRDITERKHAERLIRQNNEILESRVQERTQELRQEVEERRRVEVALQQERASLARRVEERTAALSLANQELIQAARTKDEFLASMSHELRTPLTGILGISEALLEEIYGTLAPSQIEMLRELETSGQHLLSLINDILDLAKINSGSLSIEREPVNVAELCNAALSLVRPMLAEKNLNIQVDLQVETGELLGDSRRLKQVLVNLLGNAIKFTERAGHVGLSAVRLPQRDAVRITVWDNGIGIPLDAQKNLFQPFVQVDSRLARDYQGTGLGLAIVYNLVQLHGGSVELQSIPGKGSRFSVFLPLIAGGVSHDHPPETTAVSTAQLATQEERTPEKMPLTSRKLAILIVDDNLTTLTMVANYLKAQKIEVAVAISGFEALELLKTFNPGLILMDIQMPGMDGLEAIREIRKMPNFDTTPILALTALVMPGDQERCLLAGATEYISKPVSLKQLLKTIQGLVKPAS